MPLPHRLARLAVLSVLLVPVVSAAALRRASDSARAPELSGCVDSAAMARLAARSPRLAEMRRRGCESDWEGWRSSAAR